MKNSILSFSIFLFVGLTFLSQAVTAQKARWASADDPIAIKLIEMEKMWGDANCMPHPELKDVFAEDFVGTAPDGTRYNKAHAMETDIKNPDRQCKMGDVKIQFYGENVAIAYGNESSLRKGNDSKEFLRCLVWTDTWLKKDERWQIITAQDVVVECPK
jgi:hypothetical protein